MRHLDLRGYNVSNTVAGRLKFDNSQECIAKNASGVAMRMKIRQSKTPQLYWNGQLVCTPAVGLYFCVCEDVHVTSNVELRITSDCYRTSSYVIT